MNYILPPKPKTGKISMIKTLLVLLVVATCLIYNSYKVIGTILIYEGKYSTPAAISTGGPGLDKVNATRSVVLNSDNIGTDFKAKLEETASQANTDSNSSHTVNEAQNQSEAVPLKTILVWKDEEAVRPWITEHNVKQCRHMSCSFTSDRSKAEEADLVLIQDKVLPSDWPPVRHNHQLYAHFLGERPGFWHNWLEAFDDKINLTMNYRRDADIFVRGFSYQPLTNPINTTYTPVHPFSNRTNMVVWPVSHCKAESKRDDYVKELAKHVSVHVYGKCGTFSCGVPMSEMKEYLAHKQETLECANQWERNYKFYIAFENSVCNDYITEKTYAALQHELVPIVLGGAFYEEYTPPHSVINARDFKTPKDLAEYLLQLANNEQKYNEYFQWKHEYSTGAYHTEKLCMLCEAAHKYGTGKPAHSHYYDWWFRGCDNDLVNRMRVAGKW